MEAIRLHTFGPPDNLVLEHVPDPVPGPGQVLVAATAHGVHLLDTTLRRGEGGGPLPLPALPTIPGREVAGTVAAVGSGVDAGWVGRRVAAHLGANPDGGGYARLAVVAAGSLHAVPAGLELADAVAMIGTGRTTMMLLEVARPGPQDVAVVTAAAGGIGSLATQAALEAGARVLALVGSAAKVAVVRDLAPDAGERLAVAAVPAGAEARVVTDALRRLAPDRAGADLVLDGVGGALGTAAAEVLVPGGRLAVHGWASGEANEVAERSTLAGGAAVRVLPVVGPGAPALGDPRPFQVAALERAAAGRWRVRTHRVPFAEAARAHRELEERRTTGKVVLV